MKNLFGSPGKVSGLVMRVLQCLFAAASIGIMISSSGFSTSTAFCYLIASMAIQFLWSFALACLDMHALRIKKDLHNHLLVGLFAVGDWLTSILSLAAACSSAGVVVLYVKDTGFCRTGTTLNCYGFQISVAMAFLSWFFLAISSHVMFWLMASEVAVSIYLLLTHLYTLLLDKLINQQTVTHSDIPGRGTSMPLHQLF